MMQRATGMPVRLYPGCGARQLDKDNRLPDARRDSYIYNMVSRAREARGSLPRQLTCRAVRQVSN